MNERQMLLKRISVFDFAITELRMYLDTHYDDEEISNKLKIYQEKSNNLKKKYSDKFGALTNLNDNNQNSWKWISDPWPWDSESEFEEKE